MEGKSQKQGELHGGSKSQHGPIWLVAQGENDENAMT
jgi:hypothetical protein